jgi:hypothetical protein
MFTGDVQDRGPDVRTTPQPQVSGVTDEWRHRRGQARPASTAFPAYSGPISNHFPGLTGGDFSWALGIVVGSLVYWALAGRSVRQEAAAQVARV